MELRDYYDKLQEKASQGRFLCATEATRSKQEDLSSIDKQRSWKLQKFPLSGEFYAVH